MGGIAHVRVGHAGSAPQHKRNKRASTSCTTGGFYTSPTAGQNIDVANDVNITWDTSCLDITYCDIYLYAPGAQNSRIYMWEKVDFKSGSYSTKFKPKWWNSTDSQSLQVSIIDYGVAPFLSTLPAAPIFTAKYDKNSGNVASADADTNVPDSGYTVVTTDPEPKSLTSGKIAAGILIPLLFIGLFVAAWLKFKRGRNMEKRKRFSQAIDKRMSTISTDWKSMTPSGASAAIRQSMAVSASGSGNRNSSFSFGAIRPNSSATLDYGQAGVGARGFQGENEQQMSQLRTGVGARTPSAFGEAARTSRVSFADQPRPSLESRKSGGRGVSRAFHSAYIPPLPTRQDSNESSSVLSPGILSPTQAQGALPLSNDDISYRVSVADQQNSFADVMPALSMMRTGQVEGNPPSSPGSDMLLTPITPPSPAHSKTVTANNDMMPMQPASVMSPDEMLRAYAERRAGTPSSASPSFSAVSSHGISYPTPAASAGYNNVGMRTLYSPTTPSSATPFITAGPSATAATNNLSVQDADTRKSAAPTVASAYSEDGAVDGDHAYGGTAF